MRPPARRGGRMTAGFADRLKRIRVDGGMSQRDLERLSGIPKSRISRYENGHLLPSLSGLQRLSKALGVADSVLLGEPTDGYRTFQEVLVRRGVTFRSAREAEALAHRVADLLEDTGRRAARSS